MGTFLDSIIKQVDGYRAGTLPQQSLDYLKKYFDVETSLALTKKYMNKDVLTTDYTTVYRSIDNGGNLGDAINFIQKPNEPLGRIYGVVKVLGSGTFVILDAIKQGKVRIIPIGMLKEKPQSSPYVAPVVIPDGPKTEDTPSPSGGGGMKPMMIAAIAAITLILLMKK